MRIVVVGVNYASGPAEVRERLALPAAAQESALEALKGVAREGFIVHTCNRTEVFGVVGHAVSGADVLLRFLADLGGVSVEATRSVCYVHVDGAAVRHAMRVSSGLDSMVLGEDQIQFQMKHALALARAAGTLGPTLERLGDAALACGKRVRTFTGVGRHSVSLESLAVRAALDRVADGAVPRIAIVGAGESAALVARHAHAAGAHSIIVGRTLARATVLAESVGGTARPWSQLPDVLAWADVVFGCTSSSAPTITPAAIERRRAASPDAPAAPLLCVDLSMPPTIDTAIADPAVVDVLTLDQLSQLANAHRDARREHIPSAEAIVEAEAERFEGWIESRGVAVTIRRLNAFAEAIAARELQRAGPRLEMLAPAQREAVEQLVHRIVRKLLHRPIHALKTHPEAENMALVTDVLFGDGEAALAAIGALDHDAHDAGQTPVRRSVS